MLNVECESDKPVKSVLDTDTRHLPPATCFILLIAVNARYSHTSYSTRTLKANLGELENECDILETEISITPYQLAAHIAEATPVVAGFSVYLWNVRIIEATVRILKKIAPQIKLVAGGPELTGNYPNAELFDLCIIGEGETAFREYCRKILENCRPVTPNQHTQRPVWAPGLQNNNFIITEPEHPDKLKLPYHLYTDEDIANRVIYVEASRGCPYNCSYCTSASSGLRLIPLEKLLPGLESLWQRGVRRFKFLDRSFTASRNQAYAIMDFFRERVTPETTLHFEINTDRLSEHSLKIIADFPDGILHLECGIQTLNAEVAEKIGRSPDVETTLENLKFLVEQTGADVHADLIFGLPGEDEKSFATGFNKIINSCNPPAVQVNLLKALPGTELSMKADLYKLQFNSEPPYELLESDVMDFSTLNRIQRFARCWELVHNRENFEYEIRKLIDLSEDVYGTFMTLAENIYKEEGRIHRIAKPRLKELVVKLLNSHGVTESQI